jgi:hypothetical protein
VGNLLAFLYWAQANGIRIAEHPLFGGVNPLHTSGSWHYDGKAADLNYGPIGHSAIEREMLTTAFYVARDFGLGAIHAVKGTYASAANHQGHLHVDCGSTANDGSGYSTVKPVSLLPYRLQRALRMARKNQNNRWNDATQRRVRAVRAASRFGGGEFPFGIKFTQRVIGTTPDGEWGPKSAAAHDAAVERVQRALGVGATGVWNRATETAYLAAKKEYRRA